MNCEQNQKNVMYLVKIEICIHNGGLYIKIFEYIFCSSLGLHYLCKKKII